MPHARRTNRGTESDAESPHTKGVNVFNLNKRRGDEHLTVQYVIDNKPATSTVVKLFKKLALEDARDEAEREKQGAHN